MFEPPQEKEPAGSKTLWIGLAVVALVVIAAVVFLTGKKDTASTAATSAPAAPAAKADPLHDLKIQRAVMDKDSTGTTALWAISIENRSPSYAYNDIQYETSYLNADGKVLVSNKGKLSLTLGPQEEKSTQLRDVTYPSGTATYRIKVVDATSQAQ